MPAMRAKLCKPIAGPSSFSANFTPTPPPRPPPWPSRIQPIWRRRRSPTSSSPRPAPWEPTTNSRKKIKPAGRIRCKRPRTPSRWPSSATPARGFPPPWPNWSNFASSASKAVLSRWRSVSSRSAILRARRVKIRAWPPRFFSPRPAFLTNQDKPPWPYACTKTPTRSLWKTRFSSIGVIWSILPRPCWGRAKTRKHVRFSNGSGKSFPPQAPKTPNSTRKPPLFSGWARLSSRPTESPRRKSFLPSWPRIIHGRKRFRRPITFGVSPWPKPANWTGTKPIRAHLTFGQG